MAFLELSATRAGQVQTFALDFDKEPPKENQNLSTALALEIKRFPFFGLHETVRAKE